MVGVYVNLTFRLQLWQAYVVPWYLFFEAGRETPLQVYYK